MTRLALAIVATAVLVALYSLSPLFAVALAAAGAAALTAAVAISLRRAEQDEIAHVMEIIDACVAAEQNIPEPVRLVS